MRYLLLIIFYLVSLAITLSVDRIQRFAKFIVFHIPDKIRNITRGSDKFSGRSQVMGQFRLYRCKGMSGIAASHIVSNKA